MSIAGTLNSRPEREGVGDPQVTFIATFRIGSTERLAYLETSLRETLKCVARRYPCVVVDASPGPYSEAAERLFRSHQSLSVTYVRADARLPKSWEMALSEMKTPFFAPVFDDQPVFGLDDQVLTDFTDLLNSDASVDAGMFVLASPSLTLVDPAERTIDVVPGYNPFISMYDELDEIAWLNGRAVALCRRPRFMSPFFFNNGFYRRSLFLQNLNRLLRSAPDLTAAQAEQSAEMVPKPIRRFAFLFHRACVVDIGATHTGASGRHRSLQNRLLANIGRAVAEGYAVANFALPDEGSAGREERAQVIAARLRSAYFKRLRDRVRHLKPREIAEYVVRNALDRGTWVRLRHRLGKRIRPAEAE